jgi:hypothetical protein
MIPYTGWNWDAADNGAVYQPSMMVIEPADWNYEYNEPGKEVVPFGFSRVLAPEKKAEEEATEWIW